MTFAKGVSILVSIWMHLEEFGPVAIHSVRAVSILVSIWMHLEDLVPTVMPVRVICFNPSFYLDASGSLTGVLFRPGQTRFNPSFYLDASGSLIYLSG